MEKLIYVIWKKSDTPDAAFKHEILGPTATELLACGARGLAVNLVDDLTVPGLRISQLAELMAGTVSLWLDTALDRAPVEAVLARVTARLAGYLTLESVPLVNTTHVPPPGTRIPGLYTVAFLQQPDFLTYETWLDLWQGHHTRVAIETQSTFLYIQNVLVRPLTKDAPPWTAIVEEAFPAAAGTDPMVFYRAQSAAELAEHQRRMLESCEKFIDFARLESHPMSAYVFRGIAGR